MIRVDINITLLSMVNDTSDRGMEQNITTVCGTKKVVDRSEKVILFVCVCVCTCVYGHDDQIKGRSSFVTRRFSFWISVFLFHRSSILLVLICGTDQYKD